MRTQVTIIQRAIATINSQAVERFRYIRRRRPGVQPWQQPAGTEGLCGRRFGALGLGAMLGVLIFVSGCAPIIVATAPTPNTAPVLTQISTLSALQLGLYDGDVTFAQLAQMGDFGLGTFDGVDGEMVALDGKFYQARINGSVQEVAPTTETPFADVHFFQSTQRLTVTQPLTNFVALQAYLATQLPSQNQPYALKISGTFPSVKIRSVAQQQAPYPPLADVIAQQTVFDLSNISGTLVGYFMPDYLTGVTAVGYHFHFISDDRQHGGHLLDLALTSAIVDVDPVEQIKLVIPQTVLFQDADFTPEQQ